MHGSVGLARFSFLFFKRFGDRIGFVSSEFRRFGKTGFPSEMPSAIRSFLPIMRFGLCSVLSE
ncbi:hypothetical protein RchiOBHm_Chr6g0295201 [Rosa chinensis]|uniref:Uncharacterized protein n=1 Tax=Rosa chinensis TaxID=74649 RepID=A0A2P6PX29_ROSCH|nr:hypothetical protein RchiOBHm_Chr6g0295201 [Rosa chinensis]